MARFDPPVQDTEGSAGEFLRWSHPISPIPPNESKAKAFEGAITAFEAGVKGLNKTAEEVATNVGHDAGEDIQSKRVSDVQGQYDQTFTGQQSTDTLTPDKNSSGYDESSIPGPVKDGVTSAQNVRAAREQGGLPGHIRETEYYKQLFMKASELRAQWPGYRDYIDKGFEKATGITPNANQYLKSMLADLNEAYGKKNEAANKVTSELYQNKQFPGVADGPGSILGRFSTGKLDNNQAMYELSKVVQFKGQAEYNKALMEQHSLDKETAQDTGRSAIHQYGAPNVTNAINGVIHKYFPDGNIDPNADPQIFRAMANDLKTAQTGVDKDIRAQFAGTTEKDANGRPVIKPGVLDRMGPTSDEAIKSVMAPFTTISDQLTNQEYGNINNTKNALLDLENGIKSKVFKGEDAISRTYQAIHLNSMLGGQGFQFSLTNIPDFKLPGANDGEWLKKIFGNAATPGSKVAGMANASESLDYIAKNSGNNTGVNAKAHLNDVANAIVWDGTPNANKKELTKYLFSKDWSTKIDDDKFNTKTGESVYGKSAIYYQLSKPAMSKAIDALNDPQLSSQYRSWMHDTFMHDVVPTELNQLASLQKLPGMTLRLKQDPGGGKPMKFVVDPGPNQDVRANAYGYGVSPNNPATIQFTVGKLNSAIEALYNVENKDSANGNFMQILRDHGVNLATQSGTPQNMLNELVLSIGASKGPVEGSSKDQNRVGPQLIPLRKQEGMPTQYNPTPTGGAITEQSNRPNKPWSLLDRFKGISQSTQESLRNTSRDITDQLGFGR